MAPITNSTQPVLIKAATIGSIDPRRNRTMGTSAINQWISEIQTTTTAPTLGKRKVTQLTSFNPTSFSQGANEPAHKVSADKEALPQIATPTQTDESSESDNEAIAGLPLTPSTASTLLFPFPSDCEPLTSDSDSN